ncbi:Coiled-coil domain-containing protein 83 [Labeo rohita]|uniref:Coiled-coil domain-containing protein 83 n=1 Tax=Labeo rohita TaxID=84645 RepID=A0ABQ8MA59_LABRO|nr:Coiled-coil domain-containing protein 83 [Labeo rohita]
MSKTLDKTSLSEAFIQFQIQVKKKEIQEFEEEVSQLEDKKQNLINLEQLKEEQRRHERDLQKQMKEHERNLEQRQREDEEQVKQVAQENLELKHKQEKELEELRCKLASLQVQVKELQVERETWLQYKNEGSIKDHQKIEKLEKDIALTQRIFQEISDESEQKVAQSVKDGIQLAFKKANENLDNESKLEIKEMQFLKKQVPLYKEKVAELESTVQKLEEEVLDLVSLIPELVNRPPYSLQPLAEVEGAQQKSDATTSTSSTPPDFSEMFNSQIGFTGPMHLGRLEQKLLCVIGKAYPLHPPPNDPADMGEMTTFDLLQTERWPVTTDIIHRKFKESDSQSEEADESINDTFEIQQLLDEN